MDNMRTVERIDNFTDKLNYVWKTYFQDWRFGQLMSNFLGWVQSKKEVDIFFPEESEMLRYLDEYVEDLFGKQAKSN